MSRRALIALAAASAVLLALLGTLGVALVSRSAGPVGTSGPAGRNGPAWHHGRARLDPACAATPSGPTVTLVARDMGRMGTMGWGRRDRATPGPMVLLPRAATASAGRLTVVLVNAGSRPHELVVLPLASGQAAGQRPVAADGTVSEQGALGEAEAVCPVGGETDRVAPGGSGQVTLDLRPGRYELVCNLPGHYRAGMYATLTVT